MKPKKDKFSIIEPHLSSIIMFIFLMCFFLATNITFIRYSFTENLNGVQDVSLGWLISYGSLLSFYAGSRKFNYNSGGRMGEIFVYLTGIIYLTISTAWMNNWPIVYFHIYRIPEYFSVYFIIVMSVFAGSKILYEDAPIYKFLKSLIHSANT